MKMLEILVRAEACLAELPEPTASGKTLEAYWKTFLRMLAEPVVDPLRPGDARDTYNHRRAALYAGAWRMLSDLLRDFRRAARDEDVPGVHARARALVELLDRLEPALELEPPLANGSPAIGLPASRWAAQAGKKPKRGKGSKKFDLRKLPRDWLDRLWEGTPPDWPYRSALAVAVLVPCRPVEFAPHEAEVPCGIEISLPERRRLEIRMLPAKSHDGRYGSGGHVVVLDPALAGPAAAYLADLCRENPGASLRVEVPGTNGFRKALARLGAQVFPDLEVVISGYLIRAQVIADMKATYGAGAEVAVLGGHCTDRTQASYGRVEHGRARRGIMSVRAARTPRTGHAARGAALAEARRGQRAEAAP